MNYVEISSPIVESKTFENAFDEFLQFFINIKNKVLSNHGDEYKNTLEPDLTYSKGIILSHLDTLITFSRVRDNSVENITNESYFLIRLKDIFDYILSQKSVNIAEMDLLTEILLLYYESLSKRKEILNSDDISTDKKLEQNKLEFEKFNVNFSNKEMEFYSLIDSYEEIYKNSISDTYDLLKEID